jgi:hypothetical protein
MAEAVVVYHMMENYLLQSVSYLLQSVSYRIDQHDRSGVRSDGVVWVVGLQEPNQSAAHSRFGTDEVVP